LQDNDAQHDTIAHCILELAIDVPLLETYEHAAASCFGAIVVVYTAATTVTAYTVLCAAHHRLYMYTVVHRTVLRLQQVRTA
jgi:hypothetical protein